MPNTNPINDSAEVTEFVVAEAKKAGLCNVYPIGAISVKSKGESMSPMLELKEAGCVAFSDDGRPVHNALIMRRALEYGKMFDAVLSVHEEELQLTSGFSMNESALSLKLGLVGMPGAAEDIMIARDIELARLTGGRVHFCHVSTARAVTLIRRAKEDGIPVTAEVMPHHFLLTEDAIGDYDTTYKMSMPLRKREDMEALLIGLKEGVIDCIASDHAPHEADSKNTDFSSASFGILGLQTTLPLSLSKVADGTLSMQRAIEALTVSPAKCFGLRTPTLKSGELADITIIDPKKEIKLTTKMIQSKSKNTPFIGQILKGVATKTFFKGKQVFSIEELEEV
jgi:dihydroorotase